MPIDTIEHLRREVERAYVGFSPNTHSVKPVHIANGLFRTLLGQTSNTRPLFRFVFSENHKGVVPRGHDLVAVYQSLRDEGRLDANAVTQEALGQLRVLLKKVVGADNAVFDTSMDSYSAGGEDFVSRDTIGQEGGELAAVWLSRRAPSLASTLVDALRRRDDTITLLCLPLLRHGEQSAFDPPDYEYERLGVFTAPHCEPAGKAYAELATAAATLSLHLAQQPNPLVQLRLAVQFACFFLIRHLTLLESCLVRDAHVTTPPFLLDCSQPHEHDRPLARASALTYTRGCQSLARFYAWAFGARLRERYPDPALLAREAPPTYGAQAAPDADEVWRLACEEAETADDPYTTFGQAIYDLLAAIGRYSPVSYLRMLGVRCGLLYPASNAQPAKRFMLQRDMLEVLVRGAAAPGEVLDLPELQERLWHRYGIVVGGRPEDERRLLQAGVVQADGDALEGNQRAFATALGRLDFARQLADGVLQVAV
jgi:hypothetical protein